MSHIKGQQQISYQTFILTIGYKNFVTWRELLANVDFEVLEVKTI